MASLLCRLCGSFGCLHDRIFAEQAFFDSEVDRLLGVARGELDADPERDAQAALVRAALGE